MIKSPERFDHAAFAFRETFQRADQTQKAQPENPVGLFAFEPLRRAHSPQLAAGVFKT
jgi:hypothetical protein